MVLQQQQASCVAAIDLGTNTFRLTIARMNQGAFERVLATKEAVGLGRALVGKPAVLSFEGMKRAWACLERFQAALQSYHVDRIRIVGTSALRQAVNGAEWQQTAQDILGYPIDIISGDEEGRLIYQALSTSVPHTAKAHWVFDIGGGSTEVILGTPEGIESVDSLPIGCVVLQHSYPLHWAMSTQGFAALVRHCEQCIAGAVGQERPGEQALITKGIAPLVCEVAEANGLAPTVTVSLLNEIASRMCQQRFALKGLKRSKRAIFPYGLAILKALMRHLDIQQVQVTDLGLEDALIQSLLNEPPTE